MGCSPSRPEDNGTQKSGSAKKTDTSNGDACGTPVTNGSTQSLPALAKTDFNKDPKDETATRDVQSHSLTALKDLREKEEEGENQQDFKTGCPSSAMVPPGEKIENEYHPGVRLPDLELPQAPVDFPYMHGLSYSKWPLRNYTRLNHVFNINAGPGGCASIVQVSNIYNNNNGNTAQVILHRSGFDGNHHSYANFVQSHDGHFGPSTMFGTDEDGRLLPDCLFGTNHVSLMSNDARYGHLGHGLWVQGPEDGATVDLPLNVNEGTQNGSSLVLCGGWEAGMDSATFFGGFYMVRSSYTDKKIQASFIKGEDKWKFEVGDGGNLQVTGPPRSQYAVYHNRDAMLPKGFQQTNQSKSFHTQSTDGEKGTDLLPFTSSSGVLLVMCSNTSGTDDASCAAIYLVTLSPDSKLVTSFVTGSVGKGYVSREADLWKFEISNNSVVTFGPKGPCKYGTISNMVENVKQICERCTQQLGSIVVGIDKRIIGTVVVDRESLTGWVSDAVNIAVVKNEHLMFMFDQSQLLDCSGKLSFHRAWKKDEITVGLHVIRVFAVPGDLKGGRHLWVELEGSPRQVVLQPTGVVYALNCGGPAYQAQNDIIYTSEHHQFVNLDTNYVFGTRSRAMGGVWSRASQYHLLNGSLDGFMYVNLRTPSVEAVDEQKVHYEVEGIPNGKYTLRVHGIGKGPVSTGIDFNGSSIAKEINNQVKKQPEVMEDYTAHWADVPVKVSNNKLSLYLTTQYITSFALLDGSYKEKKIEPQKQADHNLLRQKLVDEVEPLTRSLTWKEREIVGWSHNLLLNASGEMGNMTHWKAGGDWGVMEGGHGTEKAFVTSHMRCEKEQIVDLMKEFDSSYLDTAPDIQVAEWYREGVCGGGFYYFEASVLNDSGQTIKDHKSGEIGTLYRNNKWMQESVTFKNYGPGARRVRLYSWGKDDKFWGGRYGTCMSASEIRVRRETVAAKDDAFIDVVEGNDQEDLAKKNVGFIEKLVSQVLSSNKKLLQDLSAQQEITTVSPGFDNRTGSESSNKVRSRSQKKKKREIRVFVSSTFRDFKQERETLIKKTFREINAICADRGVFFTYVDLRWGITDEQTNHGKTIAICLQEISHCRPYFFCMLGERFGWSQQEDKPDDLLNESFNYAIENHPDLAWVDQYRIGTSVTKLEVLHGVLNDVESNKDRAFFYLRHPVTGGDKAMLPESDWHREQQYQLRHLVEKTAGLNVAKYNTTEQVCEKIRKDLEWCVDQDFPKGTELTPLERERESHMAFADARCRVYIGREEYFSNIDASMSEHKGSPLVILGESGSGKSALVANWVRRMEEKEPDSFIFVHFIGSSAESASYLKLLRRLYEEMKSYFTFDLAVPTSDSQLASDLPTWLRMAGTQAKCFIVFDALNQLDDGSGTEGLEHDLRWVPRILPPGVHMLLSTLPGRAMDAVKSAGWETLQVAPLDPSEKLEIVTGYMEGLYSKTLSQEQKDMIVGATQTDNPLYLKALLDEVRMYGSFRLLTQKIKEYLVANTCHELFEKILARLEEDFEHGQHERLGLVQQTTTALWCSHKGMSEAELLDFLQVPSAVWSPFYLSLVENLVNRNGILNFFHDHLRRAVESKYLATPEEKKKGYVELANFFSNRPVDDRVAEELPVLLAKAGDLERLQTVVSDLEIFRRLAKSEDGKFDLIRSWKLLGDFSQAETAYLTALNEELQQNEGLEKLANTRQEMAEFFLSLGLFDAARSLFESLLKQLEENLRESHSIIIYSPHNHSRKYRCNHASVIDLLMMLGTVCEKQKDFKKAIEFYEDAIERQYRVEDPAQILQLAQCFQGLATVYILQENMKEGKKFLIRANELATNVLGPRHHYVAAIINKLGQLMYKQGLLDDALGYFIQDLSLTRGMVGAVHPRMAGILNDVALVYDDKGDKLAGQLYEAALLTLLDTYGPAHLDVALIRYNLGSFYFATNSYARAKYQFTEALTVYSTFLGDDHPDTQEVKKALTDIASFTD